MSDDILEITPPILPYDLDAKIFWVHLCDAGDEDQKACIKAGCYKTSYRDSLQLYEDIAGVSQELLGPTDIKSQTITET
jgi:hypothetical protein